ncbi:MAG: rhodanese-like domain-containing protein [Bacillota bacterium]|nr:rhodanese-like domain-containing protein [Bacillota bacterium]
MFNFFKKVDSISAKEFIALKDKEAVLDVREVGEPAKDEKSLFKNYTLLPMSRLKQDYSKLDKNTTYYILCRTGARAVSASKFLENQGYQTVVISGGIMAIKNLI